MAAEEFEFEFKPYREIPKKKMRKIWNEITNRPFPRNIKAYILENEEYERVMELLSNCPLIVPDPIYEYNEIVKPVGSEAVCFPTSSGILILIKKNSKCTLKENLKHELEHIAKGELKLKNSQD